MKTAGVVVFNILLAGCGFSTFTQRETDPFIRDHFLNQAEPIAIMVTDSSRRLVYEFKNAKHAGPVYCADAPPDTSIAASGAISGSFSVTEPQGAAAAAAAGRGSSTSTLPLVRRSQGLQWGRDNAALECILFATGITDETQYLARLDAIRKDSKAIIEKEIEKGLGELRLGGPNPIMVIPPPKKAEPPKP